jgi:hypothetical protein
MATEEDINKIIEAVIIQDSLLVFNDILNKNTNKKDPSTKIGDTELTRNVSVDLVKLSVLHFNSHSQNNLPIPPNSIEFMSLVNFHDSDSSEYFTLSDTAYFRFQNDNTQNFSYSGKLLESMNIVQSIGYPKETESYYSFSLPILSTKKNIAYIEFTHHCKGLCGGAVGYILVRNSDVWTIAKRKVVWLS